jgi:hypothetical protein
VIPVRGCIDGKETIQEENDYKVHTEEERGRADKEKSSRKDDYGEKESGEEEPRRGDAERGERPESASPAGSGRRGCSHVSAGIGGLFSAGFWGE